MQDIVIIILGLLGAMIYFLPSVVGWSHHKRNIEAIVLLNLFLGWTLIGWVAALVWATTKDQKTVVASNTAKTSIADELIKLEQLKTSGILTEEEFAQQKAKVLG